MSELERGLFSHPVRRVSPDGTARDDDDWVVVEEPLEIRLAGDSLCVTMRTPGEDAHLALGFLFAEGVIAGARDVGHVAHCGRPGEEGFGNVIEVRPAPGVSLRAEHLEGSRRGTLTTSACGVCGRKSVEDLLARVPALPTGPPLPLALIRGAPERLGPMQPNFARTGGLHAAAILDRHGAVLAAAEDVGRHNAVDKVVGALLMAGVLGEGGDARASSPPALLVVSGRASFEIIQKAAVARIPSVIAVSAPTSLAITLAERVGITLGGFVRGGRANLYTHLARVEE